MSSFSNIFVKFICSYVTFACFSKSFIQKDLFHFLTKESALSNIWILIDDQERYIDALCEGRFAQTNIHED